MLNGTTATCMRLYCSSITARENFHSMSALVYVKKNKLIN